MLVTKKIETPGDSTSNVVGIRIASQNDEELSILRRFWDGGIKLNATNNIGSEIVITFADLIKGDNMKANASEHYRKETVDNEIEMRSTIREHVVSRMAIYDVDKLTETLKFLAMFPALATVSEVVRTIESHLDDVDGEYDE
ncbi:MAG: hypothetical protein ACTSYJ_04810 [Candidatus Thorarchaeota archaeon]